MKKIAKMLLASSCLLTVVGTLPIANDFDIKNVYAEDTETISLNDVLKGETWVCNGRISMNDTNKMYIKNFEDIAIDSSFKTQIEDIIKVHYEYFNDSADKIISNKKVIMLKENPDSEDEFLRNNIVDTFDSEISADDSVIFEVNEYYPDLNLVDANYVSEDGLTSRVVLYYSDDIIYTISQETYNEGNKNKIQLKKLNIEKYLPIDSPELDELREAVESSEAEESSEPEESSQTEEEAFNPDSYEIIAYEDIMRDRSGKMLTKHTFYAEVLQYFEDGDNAMAMLMRNGDSDLMYQAYFTKLPEQRLVEGDNVDVYGILMGLKGYETVRGNENTTPVIFIDEILIKGIDY